MRVLVAIVVLTAAAVTVACTPAPDGGLPSIAFGALTGRQPDGHAAARQVLRDRGCIYCHQIDGVPGAHGRVGPPLTGLADRVYTAGLVPGDDVLLIRFIVAPHSVRPDTAMPVTGITGEEARAVVNYLYGREP